MSQIKIIQNKNKTLHEPVLMQEVLDLLKPNVGDEYLDLTAGYGGHSGRILDITKSGAVLVDRDENAIAELTKKFGEFADVQIMHADFLEACKNLIKIGRKFDILLADLGVSSPHLDNAERGFSIVANGPLDMRMDVSQDLTAEKVVNTYSAEDLQHILREYGQEPKARKMAELIIEARPITTTQQAAQIAKKVWPGHSRVHPATRMFQAIRIEVNNELGQLKDALPLMVDLLKPGGRLAIISFHSLEDRIVKRFFKEECEQGYDAKLTELTKRPLTASKEELVFNPRARSAKIRAVVKIKTKEGQGY